MADLDKHYYVNVGKGGTFAPSGNAQFDTTAEDIDTIFQALKVANQKRLLIYFHGGLVNAADGMATAERIFRYASSQNNTSNHSHPVSFVWETGLLETIQQNVTSVGNSAFFKKLLIKIIKVAGRKLGLDLKKVDGVSSKGVGALNEEQIREELKKASPFEDVIVNSGKRSASVVAAEATPDNTIHFENVLAPEVAAEIEEEIADDPQLMQLAMQERAFIKEAEAAEGSKGFITMAALIKAAVKITIRVIRRFLKKRDHGFYPTIIEEIFREIYIAEIGTWLWSQMKNKAKAMWAEDQFTDDVEHWHAGTYFLKKMVKYREQHGELTIDLLGHSAGSIAICELLEAVAKRQIPLTFRNIVFMAPACRCELFSETVLRYQNLYHAFRCFTMQDRLECKDHLVPILYPRSLLYFISGVLEENSDDAYILGLERHIDGRKPYRNDDLLRHISTFVKENDRMVYAITEDGSLQGFCSTARHHGDFDNDGEPTLDSIFYLVNQ
jgi:hypothetical protein